MVQGSFCRVQNYTESATAKRCSEQSLHRTELTQPLPVPFSHLKPIVESCLKIQLLPVWGWKCPCTEISNTKPRAPNAAQAVLLFFFLHTGFLNQFTRKGLSSVVLSCSSACFSYIRVPLSFGLSLEVQTVFSSFWLREHLKTAAR